MSTWLCWELDRGNPKDAEEVFAKRPKEAARQYAKENFERWGKPQWMNIVLSKVGTNDHPALFVKVEARIGIGPVFYSEAPKIAFKGGAQ